MDAQLGDSFKSADVESHTPKLNASSSRFLQEICISILQWLGFRKRMMDSHLYKAAVSGDVEAIMSKLDVSLLSLVQTTPQKDTLLHISALNGHEELVKQLLLMSRTENKKLWVTVLSVLSFGTLHFCRVKNKYGNTALHEAAKASHANVISCFLKHDKSMASITNKNGERPMSLACMQGNLEAIQPFLHDDEGSYSMKKRRKDGQTCLHLAAVQGNLEVVKLLVEGSSHGMQCLEIRDSFGASPLHSAVDGGNIDVIEYILQKNPDLAYELNELGRAPIHLAAIKGDTRIIETIVKERPDCIGMKSKEGKTILHFAVQSHELELVDWISAQKFYKFWGDESDNNGNLPLHLAALYFADEQMVRTLLNSFPRCNVNAVNKEGFTCLDIVCLSKSSTERPNEVEISLRKAGAFAAEGVKERDVLNTPEEQKERYSRMIETNAVIAALFATFAVTGPTDSIKDATYFLIYMVASNVAFYSSMTVILVWILLEPLSRTRESSWIQGSMYILGFVVPATALSFFIIMLNHLEKGIKNVKDSWVVLEVLSSIMVPMATLIWIWGRMVLAYYKAKREHKEYIGMTVKRLASRLFKVFFTTVLLAVVLLQFFFNYAFAAAGIILLLPLFLLSQRISFKIRITIHVTLLAAFLWLLFAHPIWLPVPVLID